MAINQDTSVHLTDEMIIADALNNHAVNMELHNHPLDWFCVWIKQLKWFVNEWSMITMIVTDEKSRAALPDGTSCLYSNWNKVVRPDQVKVLRFSSSSWQMLQKLQPPLWPGPDVTQQRYIYMHVAYQTRVQPDLQGMTLTSLGLLLAKLYTKTDGICAATAN